MDAPSNLPKIHSRAPALGRDARLPLNRHSFRAEEDLDRVKRLAEMGVARVVPMFRPAKADKVLPMIDRWANIMRQVNR